MKRVDRIIFFSLVAGLLSLPLWMMACDTNGQVTGGKGGASAGQSGGGAPGDPAGDLGSDPRQFSSCMSDPDNPMPSCSYWTCQNIPSQFSRKTHCTSPGPSSPPPGSMPPSGPYTCPGGGGGPYCPPDIGGGSGPWMCQVVETHYECDRPAPGPGAAGSGGGAAGAGGVSGAGGAAGASGGGGGGGTFGECCNAGATRWCDTSTPAWGKQTCAPGGHWGTCTVVSTHPSACTGCSAMVYDPDCCVASGECCKKMDQHSIHGNPDGTGCSVANDSTGDQSIGKCQGLAIACGP